jgi:hypothetical protein
MNRLELWDWFVRLVVLLAFLIPVIGSLVGVFYLMSRSDWWIPLYVIWAYLVFKSVEVYFKKFD